MSETNRKAEPGQARAEANRLNAQKSTGPRTPEGKARSRQNSLIHGLSGRGVVLPAQEAEAVADLMAQFQSSVKAQAPLEMVLLRIIAVESVRLERHRAEEEYERDRFTREAASHWDDMRRAEAEALGKKLADNPAEIALKLAMTRAGCDWMIARWQMLGRKLDAIGTWSDEDRSLANDLLGHAHVLRANADDPDAPKGEDLLAHRRDVVAAELHRLEARKLEHLDDLDADDRAAAIAGLDTSGRPEISRRRRNENMSMRRMVWAMEHILRRHHLDEPPPQNSNGSYRGGIRPMTTEEFLRRQAEEDRGRDARQGTRASGAEAHAGAGEARAGSKSVTPISLAWKMRDLFPPTAEEAAERSLYGPTSDRFPTSEKAAKRERNARIRLARKAAELEQQARRL